MFFPFRLGCPDRRVSRASLPPPAVAQLDGLRTISIIDSFHSIRPAFVVGATQAAEPPGKQHCENYRRPSLPARDLPAGRPVLAQPSASISGSRSLWKRERPDNRSGPFTQARLRTSALTRPQATAPPAPPPVTSSGDTVPTLPLVGSIGLSTHSGSALAKRSKSRGWFGLRTEGLRCGEQLALHPGGEGR